MTARGRQRANGEGSIFPYRNGYAAYVWVITPDGKRRRKWAYGKTRQDVHGKWLKLHDAMRRGPVPTSTPTLAEYMAYWLREVVIPPNYAPLTYATYETLTRLYVLPGLGAKRLDKLTLRDVRSWLSKLRDTCQCCAQGKDARRAEKQRRCCAKVPPMCCRRPAPSVGSTHTRRLAPRHPGARHHLGLPLQRDRALPCPDPPRTRLLPNLVTDGFGQDRLCVYMNHAASPERLPCGDRQP